jgi:hypothetical protein
MVNPWRWPECGTDCERPWWGACHENHAKIAGVTAQMAEVVDLDKWVIGQPWDNRITSSGLSFVASWGDGEHLTAYCDWERGNTHSVTVGGLLGDKCNLAVFDYLTGDASRTVSNLPITDGKAVFDVPCVETRCAFYLKAVDDGEPPPPPPVEPVYTLRVTAVLEEDGEPIRTLSGVLSEVE